MQNENKKRVWLYARIPGNDVETLRCIRECAAKAQQDNCKIVGISADEKYGWLLRLGFIGDEFATARRVFTNRLPGDTAFRHGRPTKTAETAA